jgi:hypothetical protein
MGIIYLAKNLTNGKKYVGQTIHSTHERRGYRRISQKPLSANDRYFERALKKYGYDGFEWRILFDGVTPEEMDVLEIECMQVYETLHPKGYNLRTGGRAGGAHARPTRIKLIIAQLRRDPATRKHTAEAKAKIAESNRRRGVSQATRLKICRSVAKIKEEDVVTIRERYAAGELPQHIAVDYGCKRDNIIAIVKGTSWKYVGGPLGARPRGARCGEQNPRWRGGKKKQED